MTSRFLLCLSLVGLASAVTVQKKDEFDIPGTPKIHALVENTTFLDNSRAAEKSSQEEKPMDEYRTVFNLKTPPQQNMFCARGVDATGNHSQEMAEGILLQAYAQGATQLLVSHAGSFSTDRFATLNGEEDVHISCVGPQMLQLSTPLKNSHRMGEKISLIHDDEIGKSTKSTHLSLIHAPNKVPDDAAAPTNEEGALDAVEELPQIAAMPPPSREALQWDTAPKNIMKASKQEFLDQFFTMDTMNDKSSQGVAYGDVYDRVDS